MKKYFAIIIMIFSGVGSFAIAEVACQKALLKIPARIGNFHTRAERSFKYTVARPDLQKNYREHIFTSDGEFMFVRGGGTERMFAYFESASAEQITFVQAGKRFIIRSDNSVTVELMDRANKEVWSRTTYYGLKAEDMDE